MKHDLTTKIQKKGQGRYELLKQALDTGNLNQPGLMLAVANAVTDGSHEFADFVAERVLPAYGAAALPLLVAAFVPSGKLPDVRRLRAIWRIDQEEARRLARSGILSRFEGMVTESILILSRSQQDEPLLLQQAAMRKGSLRVAAYKALKGCTSLMVVDQVTRAFRNGVSEAAEAMTSTLAPPYTEAAVEVLQKLLSDPQNPFLAAAFRACTGHKGAALDTVLCEWMRYYQELPPENRPERLFEAVALGAVPEAQRFFVTNRAAFCKPFEMIYPMCAASWHADLCLFDLFSPYLFIVSPQARCRGWYCMGANPWSCSLLSSVEFALDVDFDAPNYTGAKPLDSQRLLIERIRADHRWQRAREQAAEVEAKARIRK